MMDTDGGCARFAHLLQPIRDLSQNWEIDIASLLADYLEEIDKIAITFDDGATTMNFAEAALLIQGSASIYSKKIEYLYSLVYQTLNLLASNKQMEQGASVDEAGNDKDTSFDRNKRKDEDFLALDDIKQGNDIDLAEEGDAAVKPVSTLPKAPIALIPLGEVEKRNNALLSRNGELLGSRKDFRMNTCKCHPSGALLMDYADLALLPRSLSSPTMPRLAPDSDASRHGQPAADASMSFGSGAAMDDGSLSMTEMQAAQTFAVPPPDLTILLPPGEDGDVRQSRRLALASSSTPRTSSDRVRDPWAVLDPHENSSQSETKAYRRGRPFRVPAALSAAAKGQKASKKRAHQDGDNSSESAPSRNGNVESPPAMPLLEFCRLAFHSHSSRFPSNFLKAPSFADFEDLFWTEQKRRRQQLKKERDLYRAQLSREEEEYAFDDKEYSDDDDDGRPTFDPSRRDLDITAPATDALQRTGSHVGPADDDMGAVSDDDGGVFAQIGQVDFDGIAPMAIEDGPLSQFVVSSYEDLVRQHVDGFITSANQYLKESDLARRVREWEERIKPVLDEEEEHPPYDIHAYGWQVLQTFGQENNPTGGGDGEIDFARVATGKKQFEVCRLFLASLQLANNRNVDIVCGSADRNSMQMKLLQTEQIHTRLEQYQAPSLATLD